MLIQYIGYIKVTVGTSGPGYHSKCQLKWSNLASEAHGELHGNLQAHRPETYRKLHGNLEPVGSCSPGWARTGPAEPIGSSSSGWAGRSQKVS